MFLGSSLRKGSVWSFYTLNARSREQAVQTTMIGQTWSNHWRRLEPHLFWGDPDIRLWGANAVGPAFNSSQWSIRKPESEKGIDLDCQVITFDLHRHMLGDSFKCLVRDFGVIGLVWGKCFICLLIILISSYPFKQWLMTPWFVSRDSIIWFHVSFYISLFPEGQIAAPRAKSEQLPTVRGMHFQYPDATFGLSWGHTQRGNRLNIWG